MTDRHSFDGKARSGDYVVRAPRLGDAIGQMLKGVYPARDIPADMQGLLGQLERVQF